MNTYKETINGKIYRISGEAGGLVELLNDNNYALYVTKKELEENFEPTLDINDPYAINFYR